MTNYNIALWKASNRMWICQNPFQAMDWVRFWTWWDLRRILLGDKKMLEEDGNTERMLGVIDAELAIYIYFERLLLGRAP